MFRSSLALALLPVVFLGACQSQTTADPAQPSNLTSGMVKKTVQRGTTTQAEVLEVFGPPNLVTHKDGQEVWTYDRVSREITESNGYLNVLVAGTGTSSARSSSVSTMLIIYFDAHDVVQDYRMSVAKF